MGLRHIHVLFGWMATTLGYILRADMSVAVVEMSDWTKQPDANFTDTGSKVPRQTSVPSLLILKHDE